jgi:CBS domain-containing protein
MRNEPISRVMTRSPATVGPGQSVAAAERLMRERGFHHVPVVDGGRLLGMVGSPDLLKALILPSTTETEGGRSPLESRHVSEIMQRSLVALGENATVLDAAQALAHGGVHALPVVAPGNILVGIVTSTDLIDMLADGLKHPAAETTHELTEAGSRPIDEETRLLRQVLRAAVAYLNSGQAEQQHVRLLQAVERARDARLEVNI